MNQKGFPFIIVIVVGLVLLLAAIAYLGGAQAGEAFWNANQNEIRAEICKNAGIPEVYDEGFTDVTRRRCNEDDLNFRKAVFDFATNAGLKPYEDIAHLGAVEAVLTKIKETVTYGEEFFPKYSIHDIHCWRETTYFLFWPTGYNTFADMTMVEKCADSGKTCDNLTPENVVCKEIPVNPPDLFYVCDAPNKMCKEKTCNMAEIKNSSLSKLQGVCGQNILAFTAQQWIDNGIPGGMVDTPEKVTTAANCVSPICTTFTSGGDIATLTPGAGCLPIICQLSNTDGCNVDKNEVANSCAQAPPGLDCGDAATQQAGCATKEDGSLKQAWEIECEAKNIPTNRQACHDAGFDADPNTEGQQDLSCLGGEDGSYCPSETDYCEYNGATGECKPISAALCDEPAPKNGSPLSAQQESGLLLVNGETNCSGQKTEGKYGIKCATGICDVRGNDEGEDGIPGNPGTCINPELSAYSPDYEFEIGGDISKNERGIGLNFKPVANSAYKYPQFCAPTVYCPSCADQLIETKDLEEGLAFSFNKVKAKGGVLRFQMSARGASGQNNFARIRFNDVQSDGANKKVKSEEFIVEVDAPQISECALESGGNMIGDSGNKARASIKYNWDFGKSETIGYQFCEIIDNSTSHKPYVCDSTQFMISLMKRLQKIRTHYDAQEFAAGDALKQFNALLMTDSFNQNFRNDFVSHYTSASFADTPTWFKEEGGMPDAFQKYVSDPAHLTINPETISKPGKYRVTIDFAGTAFFNASNEPAMTITIGFIPLQTPINMDNALYYLPVDGGVMNAAFNREGYGIGTGTESGAKIDVLFKTESSPLQTTGGLRPVVGKTLSAFSETNKQENRGRILQVKLVFEGEEPTQLVRASEPKIVLYAPITATPVAIKIPENESLVENKHFAKYQFKEDVVLPSLESDKVSSWTGLAASRRTTADPPCSDFKGVPLATKGNDERTDDAETIRALSFSKATNSTPAKFLVFGSVFYAPRQQSIGLKTIQSGLQLLTPNEKKEAGSYVSLNYTDDASKFSHYPSPNDLRITHLQDLIDVVNGNSNADSGAICMITKKTMNGNQLKAIETVYYWNRGVLLNEIVDKAGDNDSTKLAIPGTNNNISQFSVIDEMRCN